MKKKLLITFIILALLGFATSLFLTVEHFIDSKGACDINATISCSLVNSSIYSEIFGVPVAIFGMFWFMGLFLFAWKAYTKKDKKNDKRLIYWNIMGFIFVVWLVTAEILLKAVCPFCTIVHIIVLSTLVLSIYSYKRGVVLNGEKKESSEKKSEEESGKKETES
jgi:uncharacterized membrane protein